MASPHELIIGFIKEICFTEKFKRWGRTERGTLIRLVLHYKDRSMKNSVGRGENDNSNIGRLEFWNRILLKFAHFFFESSSIRSSSKTTFMLISSEWRGVLLTCFLLYRFLLIVVSFNVRWFVKLRIVHISSCHCLFTEFPECHESRDSQSRKIA